MFHLAPTRGLGLFSHTVVIAVLLEFRSVTQSVTELRCGSALELAAVLRCCSTNTHTHTHEQSPRSFVLPFPLSSPPPLHFFCSLSLAVLTSSSISSTPLDQPGSGQSLCCPTADVTCSSCFVLCIYSNAVMM